MTDFAKMHCFKELPDRDSAIEMIFGFLKALADKDPDKAELFVLVKNMTQFRQLLDEALRSYLSLIIEDEEWEIYNNKDLSLEIGDPFKEDEDEMLPEFTGNLFQLTKGEGISLQLFMRGMVTPIRLHFDVAESDLLYYIRLCKITAA